MARPRKKNPTQRKWPLVRTIWRRDGTTSFEVDTGGKLSPRIRKRFDFEEQALIYADRLRQRLVQSGMEGFTLPPEQRADAKAAYEMLEGRPHSLVECVRFFLRHHCPPEGKIAVDDLAGLYLARQQSKGLRRRSMEDLRARLSRFCAAFQGRPVVEIAAREIDRWLMGLGLSAQTVNNYRRVLHGFFRFAERQGYLTRGANPAAEVEALKVARPAPEIFTVAEAEQLLRTAAARPDLGLVAYLSLGFFAGLRRSELAGLEWRDIYEREGEAFVSVSERIAKGRSIRNVDLPACALAWLKLADRSKRICPPGLGKRLNELVAAAGGDEGPWRWVPNGLRHSFASHHLAMTGNPTLTAAALGHVSGTQLLFQHYRRLVKGSEGRAFFEITPGQTGGGAG